MIANMKTSIEGREMIKKLEGLRLSIYDDQVGKKTIGYGHLVPLNGKTKVESTITLAKAEELLDGDLLTAENAVKVLVKILITQGQFNALVSLIFNVGKEDICKSKALKYLNTGNYITAELEFFNPMRGFVFAGGKINHGLVTRRAIELNMWRMIL